MKDLVIENNKNTGIKDDKIIEMKSMEKNTEEEKHDNKINNNNEILDQMNNNSDNFKTNIKVSELILKDRYKLIKLLGSGSFGEIHLAYDNYKQKLCSIKFELINTKNPQLKNEFTILEILNNTNESNIGFPKVYTFDRIDNKANYMVMDFLGPSLGDLFNYREKMFSLTTVLLLTIQMIERIEVLHEKGYIHRDIKPENFLMGLNKTSNTLHLIDFGLSKRYKDKITNIHIPYRENRNLVGTARYASINTHLGIEQSRRDDLESIGYLLVYFLMGKLPWQSKNDKGKDPNKIRDKKIIITPEVLCKKLPIEFSFYFHYVKSLKFQERPDYHKLKGLFFNVLASNSEIQNQIYCFDWFDDMKNMSENDNLSDSDNKSEESIKINRENKSKENKKYAIKKNNKGAEDLNYFKEETNVTYGMSSNKRIIMERGKFVLYRKYS